jgi:Bacterial PH domain
VAMKDFPCEMRKTRGRVWFAALSAAAAIPTVLIAMSLLTAGQLRYEVTSKALTIHTSRGLTGDTKIIPLERIRSMSDAWLANGVMRFGQQKPGYCVGFYRYGTLDEVWQATNCSESGVVIKADGEVMPVVVTPADPYGFQKAVDAGTAGVFLPPGSKASSWWGTLMEIVVLYVLVELLFAAAFLIAPSRLRYRVGDGAMEVRTFFKRRRVPVKGVWVYTHRPLDGAKLSGIALPGYNVGSWELDTQPTNVFAAHREKGVVVEGDERVFVTPRDAAAMLDALGAAGATIGKP